MNISQKNTLLFDPATLFLELYLGSQKCSVEMVAELCLLQHHSQLPECKNHPSDKEN